MTTRALSSNAGFSMIEVIMTIAIVAILAGLATPSFTEVTQKFRGLGEANALARDLRFARTEAIKQGLSAQLCVSTDGATCSTSTNWQLGWIVLNLNLDGTPGTVLKTQRGFSSADTLVSNPAVAAITFNREGFTTGTADLLFSTTVNPGNRVVQCVSLSRTGRQAVSSPATGGGAC